MIIRRFTWAEPAELAAGLRQWFGEAGREVDVGPIEAEVAAGGDAALMRLTARFDATEAAPPELRVDLSQAESSLEAADDDVVAALRIAIENVRSVARAQVDDAETVLELAQGQVVTTGQVPVGSAGIYAPGGRAAYPSSVVMGCVTARAAGVERVVLVSPPGPDGRIDPTTLAAAALCEVDEIYAVGGAQAVFALARGTESIEPVDVIAGPGNDWVQEAKRRVFGEVGIDSPAGPSDLMVVIDAETELGLVALDLCAQSEHGSESPLVAVGPDRASLDRLAAEVESVAGREPTVNQCRLALVAAPGAEAAVELANAFAPEHLQLMDPGSAALAATVRTAGCVFTGAESGTAYGDYLAGSNHVLPTGGAGRIFGPLSPATFRRNTARVSLGVQAAASLAGPLEALARAEGLPVHGLSARARAERSEEDDG
ncbi:MAG: histidinol dehydrogenase [Solirubrobacterales bacterium]|nr:histidinol dehydrogenase [Solirubrobacterales bacterium]